MVSQLWLVDRSQYDEILIDCYRDADWCMVEHGTTHEKGYVPSNYVVQENTLGSMDWYHGKISRKDCEKQLLLAGNVRGTFCVRQSEKSTAPYSLSVRNYSEEKGHHINHYKVNTLDSGEFYIWIHSKHPTLNALVEHYKATSDGLCCKLTNSFPKVQPLLLDLSKHTQDQWEIRREQIEFGKEIKLGNGQFGQVWEGRWNTHTKVAIKTRKEGIMSPEGFLEEAAIMMKCCHDKVVQLYALCSDKEPIFIVMELMCNGSLQLYLRSDIGQKLSLDILMDMVAQIAEGMAYLEHEKLVHRDVAARSILVGENNTCKVANFAHAKIMEDDKYQATKGEKFPIKWTALEAALYGEFTIKSDVWSFGITMVEIITFGEVPYLGKTNEEVLTLVGI